MILLTMAKKLKLHGYVGKQCLREGKAFYSSKIATIS